MFRAPGINGYTWPYWRWVGVRVIAMAVLLDLILSLHRDGGLVFYLLAFVVAATGAAIVSAPLAPREQPIPVNHGAGEIRLEAVGPRTLDVVKALRETADMPFYQAKRITEATPVTLRLGATRDDAQRVAEALTAAGATAELLP